MGRLKAPLNVLNPHICPEVTEVRVSNTVWRIFSVKGQKGVPKKAHAAQRHHAKCAQTSRD